MHFLKQFSLLTLFTTAATSAIFGQKGSFDLRLSLNSVDCKTGKALVSVQVKASDDAQIFQMGDANYRFEYNPSQLRNPSILRQENFSNQAVQVDRNYGLQNLQGSREIANQGIVSLNAFYTGSNAGAKLVPNSCRTSRRPGQLLRRGVVLQAAARRHRPRFGDAVACHAALRAERCAMFRAMGLPCPAGSIVRGP